MKSPVWHIFKKDLVRFRLHLALWCAILISRVACAEWAGAPQDSAQQAGAMSWVALVFLFNVHLVVRLLAEDSPLKEAAFWRTKPVTGGQMLAAKAMFIAIWTVLVPAGVIAATALGYGFTGGELMAVVAGQVVLHGFIGLVFLTAAAFFERVIASVICFLLFGVFLSFTAAHRVTTDTVASFDRNSLVVTRTILAGGFLLAGCGLACWLVYLSRKRVLAAVVVALSLAAMKATTMLWTVDCLDWVTVLNSKEPRTDSAYVVELSQVDSSGRSNINGVNYHWITAAMNEAGLADARVTRPYRLEGRVEWPDRTASLQNREDSTPRAQNLDMMLQHLGIQQIAISPYGSDSGKVFLAQLRDAEIEKLRQTPATWRGNISSVIGRIEVKARLPLVTGANFEQGAYRFAINERLIKNDGINLEVSERRAGPPRWTESGWKFRDLNTGREAAYALINARRKEGIFPTNNEGKSETRDGLFEFNWAKIQFSIAKNGGKLTPEE